jgi:site-specific recombinase XerD
LNVHTARAYATAQRDYQAFVKRSGQSDLSAWVEDMQRRGLAANTIRQRAYLVRAWLGVEENVALPARRTVRETKWLDVEQVRGILSVIPKDRIGRRDFALLAALLVTDLRVGQVRTWKVSEIRCSGGSARVRDRNIPKVVCEALQAAFEQYGNSHFNNMSLSYIVEDDHVFTTSQCRQPLSPQEINRRIGRYARLAGLEPQGVTAECLRRTYKELGQHTVITLVQDSLANRKVRSVRWKRVDRDVRLHGIGRRSG